MNQFPPEVIEELRSYVYLYLDPRDQKIFYVGKGIGNRAFSHLHDESDSKKAEHIQGIRTSGLEPIIEILRFGLTDDQAALVEASVIDTLSLGSLSNQCRGIHSKSLGRISVGDVIAEISAEPAECIDPLMLIKINRLFRSDMSELELYEATRGTWVLGRRREKAKYACAVFRGVVREVYQIDEWNPAGTKDYSTRDDSAFAGNGRWEFCGRKAPETVRNRYLLRSVRHLQGASAQNPIRYVNC